MSGRVSVRPGIEVLLNDRRDLIRGKRLGLVTNHTGRDRRGRSTVALLHARQDAQLVALFGPEHGLRGGAAAGERVPTAVDSGTGLPVFSLYGEATRPTAAMLGDVDTLLFDIQDIGARVFTYGATLAEVLRAGAEHGIPVVVLDRPNPINGIEVEGNVLDERFASFVGPAPLAMRHGMTVGEIGRFLNAELGVGANLTVVAMAGWHRDRWYDETGLPWVNPSPNLRSLAAATLYPGIVLFEGTNLSEGRGTDRPFEWVGAPWVNAATWADRLNGATLGGVRFRPQRAVPTTATFAGERCEGVLVEITDSARVRPMALGLAMVAAVRELHPDRFRFTAGFDRLAGTDEVRGALDDGRDPSEIAASWQTELRRFLGRRATHLLY